MLRRSIGFTITPDTGYGVLDVLVDGVSVGQETSYEFTDVQANHTIAASFAAAPGEVTLISPEGNIGNVYQPTYAFVSPYQILGRSARLCKSPLERGPPSWAELCHWALRSESRGGRGLGYYRGYS